uniref:Uncharacterized protein n=1 Tax=Kalanchoe fedtschenkoi TaxID=63787 RepID=A0A7N0VGR8_KALFE
MRWSSHGVEDDGKLEHGSDELLILISCYFILASNVYIHYYMLGACNKTMSFGCVCMNLIRGGGYTLHMYYFHPNIIVILYIKFSGLKMYKY